MQAPRGENRMELQGRAAAEPALSHSNHGTDYYTFPLAVPRLSGAEDELNIVLTARQRELWQPEAGQWLRVRGEVRSYNNRSGVGSRLVITVLARSLTAAEEETGVNRLILSGALCKPPVVRRTPLGREICDLLLAVNRTYGRADYLPCIAWGQTAMQIAEMDVGDRLTIEGRVQSRTYTKQLETGSEERTAFEVSVMQLVEETEDPNVERS